MTDRKLLELAPGSRWDERGDIESADGHSFGIWPATVAPCYVSGSGPAIDIPWTADTRDLIALLHRAGLLDELLAEAWDEGASEAFDQADGIGWSAVALDKFYAENPYRKAGK